MGCVVTLPAKWVSAENFETALRSSPPHPHDSEGTTFVLPEGSKVMIDAAVRILSLANQLDSCSHRVSLIFDEGYEGAMGYLDRMGFFELLAPTIEIKPPRSILRGSSLFSGGNPDLVEISRVAATGADKSLRDKLAESVRHACASRPDVTQLSDAVWTIFSELFDNISQHSQTRLDAFAALQTYRGGKSVRVVVSDSGKGILHTLRPALETHHPKLSRKSDSEVLLEVFRQGVSRLNQPERGCGLKGCAKKAIRYNATLEVRLPTSRVVLKPSNNQYVLATAQCSDRLPLIWGTQLTFDLSQSEPYSLFQ